MNASNSPSAVLAIADVSPFCQLVGRDIPATQCLEMQGQEGCFGCAAPTRLCEDCKAVPVDVPAVGLCSKCLVLQLRREEIDKFFEKPPESLVQCQIIKGEIRVEMCLATQDQEGCKNCPAPSRLCEKCKERPCRIPQYGLCLHCSVEEFGEGWNFDEAAALPEVKTTALNDVAPADVEAQPPADQPTTSPEVVGMLGEVRPVIEGRNKINVATLRGQLPYLSRELARTILDECERKGWVGPAIETGGWRQVLIIGLNHLRELVQKKVNVREAVLVDELRPLVSKDEARRFLEQFEREGLVGPAVRYGWRRVLVGAKGGKNLCKNCRKRRIILRKLGFCKQCSTKLYRGALSEPPDSGRNVRTRKTAQARRHKFSIYHEVFTLKELINVFEEDQKLSKDRSYRRHLIETVEVLRSVITDLLSLRMGTRSAKHVRKHVKK